MNRNKLKVMGEVRSPDVVMKNKSTTIYGNIVAFDQSPLNADVFFYAGTDDGLIQVSTDGGETWSKEGDFPGVPTMTYVNMKQGRLSMMKMWCTLRSTIISEAISSRTL